MLAIRSRFPTWMTRRIRVSYHTHYVAFFNAPAREPSKICPRTRLLYGTTRFGNSTPVSAHYLHRSGANTCLAAYVATYLGRYVFFQYSIFV